MNIQKKSIQYFLLLLILTYSCSIEKRVHLPGKYVMWETKEYKNNHNKIKTAKSQKNEAQVKPDLKDKYELVQKDSQNCSNINLIASSDEIQLLTQQIKEITINEDIQKQKLIVNDNQNIYALSRLSVILNGCIFANEVMQKHLSFDNIDNNKFYKPISNRYSRKNELLVQNENPDKPKINRMALTGFILSLTSIFPVVIFYFLQAEIEAYFILKYSHFFVFLSFSLTFIYSVIGVIFCILGLKKILNERKKWRGKTLAIIGICLGLLFALYGISEFLVLFNVL